jgi:hypothetical protein
MPEIFYFIAIVQKLNIERENKFHILLILSYDSFNAINNERIFSIL